MELIYNEAIGEWEEHIEPYATIEVETKEDFDEIMNALEFWREHKKGLQHGQV